MENLTIKDKIVATVNEVREASFKEKTSSFGLDTEERINSFLDKILTFKKILTEKTQKIELFSEKLESLTWFNEVDEECLKLLNDLIATVKDWHSSLIRQYVSMNMLRKKSIASEEINDFKYAVDGLKEVANDLESIFFFLPQNQDFQETTKELQLV